MKLLKWLLRFYAPGVVGWDDLLYAGAAAATSAYSANQANQTSAGNAFMQNMTNMVMQVQNQGYNAEQASLAREFNSDEARIARDFNAEQSQTNRDFQERLSNTSYQRAVGDMKAAGLNPMLAYSQGGAQGANGSAASISGASGPSASSGGWAGAVSPTFSPPLAGVAQSATGIAQKIADVKKTDAETSLLKANVPKTERETQNLEEMNKNIKQTLNLLQEQTRTEGFRGNREQYESYVSLQREELTEIQTRLEEGRISLTKAQEDTERVKQNVMKLEAQIMKPDADKAGGTWGSKVSPYLKDFGQIINGAGALRGMTR